MTLPRSYSYSVSRIFQNSVSESATIDSTRIKASEITEFGSSFILRQSIRIISVTMRFSYNARYLDTNR